MKKNYLLLPLMLIAAAASAQNTTSAMLNKLAVPASPAFSITDITPSLVQSPSTPKAFALGVAQSVQDGGSLFPNNFSAQFAPVWWIAPNGLNAYNFLGVKPKINGTDTTWVQDNFSGIKYSMLSVAFINKDMIPDAATTTQKIYSIGLHTNLLKLYAKQGGKTHAELLAQKMKRWHDTTLAELADNQQIQVQLTRLELAHPNHNDTAYINGARRILHNYKDTRSRGLLNEINDLIAEKPLFAWDIAGAIAVYGVDDQTVKTGRTAIWTQLSTYIPLGNISNGNYFTLSAMGRYLADNFEKNDKGVIGLVNNKDIGANAGFEFNRLSISVESLYRFASQLSGTENRTVGVLNVRVSDNLIVSGSFGKDFAGPNKLISVFGINLGLGKEKVTLP